MAIFGRFETVHELARGRLCTVLEAKQTGGDGEVCFVVKVLHPAIGALSNTVSEAAVKRFLDQAQVQQKVAQGGGKQWAPIHELGQAEEGAFYVTDRYARSVRRQILGQVKLDELGLHPIVKCVVTGLIGLQEMGGRAHGNLKPENLLLSGLGPNETLQVFLSDPLPTQRLKGCGGLTGDLHALGTVIYELMLHQKFRVMGGWPVGDSRDWARLGKNRDKWRDLCNLLLNPELSKQCPTLQELLEEQIPTPILKKSRGWRCGLVGAGLGLAVVAAVPSFLPADSYWRSLAPWYQSQPLKFDQEKWAYLCRQSLDWFGLLYYHYENDQLTGWDSDQTGLQSVLAALVLIEQEQVQWNPEDLADAGGRDLESLIQNPPEATKNPENIQKIHIAYGRIKSVADELELWAPLVEIRRQSAQYAARGWEAPAKYLDRLADAATPSSVDKNIGIEGGVDQVLKHQTRLEKVFAEVDTRYAELNLERWQGAADGQVYKVFAEFCVNYLSHAGGPVDHALDAMPAKLEELLTQKPQVDVLGQEMANIQEGIDLIKEVLEGKVSTEQLQQRLDRHTTNFRTVVDASISQGELGSIPDTISSVLASLPKLKGDVDRFLEDPPPYPNPRPSWVASELPDLDEIRSRVVRLQDQYQDKQNGQKYSAELDSLNKGIASLLKLPWTRRYQGKIESEQSRLQSEAAALAKKVDTQLSYMSRPLDPPDPRQALIDNLDTIQPQIDQLAIYDRTQAEAYRTQYHKLEQALVGQDKWPWIQAFEEQVNTNTAQVRSSLQDLDRRVFEGLDPRLYWGWQDTVVAITDAIQSEDVSQQDVKQLEAIQSKIAAFDDRTSVAWTRSGYRSIEQQYQGLRDQLEELKGRVIRDPRDAWGTQWGRLSQLIQDAIAQRQAMGDRQTAQYEALRVETSQRQASLRGRLWPDDPVAQQQIHEEVKRQQAKAQQLYDQLDPRDLWVVQDRENAIKGGIERARNEGDRQAEGYVQELALAQSEHARLMQIAWAPGQQNVIFRGIHDLDDTLDNLRQQAVKDPREQVQWGTIMFQLAREIGRLDRSNPSRSRLLESQLGAVRETVGQLRKLPLVTGNESQIERQVSDAVKRLREIYVTSIAEQPQIEGLASEAINEVWRAQRGQLITNMVDLTQLQTRVKRLRDFLAGHDRQLSSVVPDRPRPRGWQDALANEIVFQKREAVLREALGSLAWQQGSPIVDQGQWVSMRDGYKMWLDDVGDLMEDFRVFENLLDNAYGLEDVPPGQSLSIKQTYTRWETKAAFEDFREVIQSVVTRLVSLQRIAKNNDRVFLVDLASRQASPDPSVAFSAWRRLSDAAGSPWPSDLDELNKEHRARQWLASIIRVTVQDPAQQSRLSGELVQAGQERWSACFSQLTNANHLDEAIKLLPEFEVKVNTLSGYAQYDVLLGQQRLSLAAQGSGTGDGQIQQQIQALIREVESLPPNIASQADVVDFTDALEELLEAPADEQSQDSMAALGPMKSPILDRIRWQQTMSDDGTRLAYTWKTRTAQHVLDFVRVDAGKGVEKPFFLCTTEVPFGLFKDVIRYSKLAGPFITLLGDPAWNGPKVWRWQSDKNRGIKTNTGAGGARWTPIDSLRTSGGGQAPDYSPGVDPGKPSNDHPMQYVSPEAAMYFAKLLGCRLPSSAEWVAAFDGQRGSRTAREYIAQERPNLYDQTLAKQSTHVEALRGRGVRVGGIEPDSGSLWERPEPTGAWGIDDGVLWFDLINSKSAQGFKHLIGNVAEWVYDGADEFTNPDGGLLPASQFRSRMKSEFLGVIGGSAQSSADIPVDRKQPVQLTSGAGGYSDVGLRLALTVPREPLYTKLKKVLDQQDYITAASVGEAPTVH